MAQRQYEPRGKLYNTARKNKTIFWTVSHCTTDNFREKYVEKLRKYIEVDVFGECSGIECLRGMKGSCFATQGRVTRSVHNKLHINLNHMDRFLSIFD